MKADQFLSYRCGYTNVKTGMHQDAGKDFDLYLEQETQRSNSKSPVNRIGQLVSNMQIENLWALNLVPDVNKWTYQQ